MEVPEGGLMQYNDTPDTECSMTVMSLMLS